MERHWTRDWLGWFLITVPLLAILGFVNVARDLGQPFGGYLSYSWINQSHGTVDTPTPIWWSGFIEGGLTLRGDLLQVDGQTYSNNVRSAMVTADASGATVVSIVQDDPQRGPTTRQVPVIPFDLQHMLDFRLPNWINASAFWLLAIAVFQAAPQAATNRSFALVAGLVSANLFLSNHSIFIGETGYSNLVQSLFIATASLIGPALILFAFNFPAPTAVNWRSSLVTFAILLGIVTAVLAVLAEMPWLPASPVSWNIVLGDVSYMMMIATLSLGLVAMLARLIRIGLRARTSRRNRRVALVLLAGFLLSLPTIVLTFMDGVLVEVGRNAGAFLGGLDLRYLFVAVAIAFAYVIIRYQSMRQPSYVFVGVLLLSLSGLFAGLGAWLWTLVQTDWPANMQSPPFLLLFVVALSSGMVWAVISTGRGVLGRFFDWERFGYSATRDFGRRVMRNAELRVLPQTIADVLVDELQVEQAGVWLSTPQDPCLLHLAGQAGSRRDGWPQVLSLEANESDVTTPFALAPGRVTSAWCRALLSARFETIAPLRSDGRLLGIIALGTRWDEIIFDERDLELAELIAQQAALFIVAGQTTEELRRMPGRIAEAQEQERTRMAQELHDTVQQFLGRLPFYLAVSRDKVESHPHQAAELLDRSIDDVEEAARSLRTIRQNLAPSQLQGGLGLPLLAMATEFRNRTGLPLTMTVAPQIESLTTLETRHVLYRAIQQSLDNVSAHAAATEVTVIVDRHEDRVSFSVVDDGRGFTEAQRLESQRDGSFGLISMQARLESCGGGLAVQSTVDVGTVVCGWVPVLPDGH